MSVRWGWESWRGGRQGSSREVVCVCTELSCSETTFSLDVLSCATIWQETCDQPEGGSAASGNISRVPVSGLG